MVIGTDMPDSYAKWFWLALTIVAGIAILSFIQSSDANTELAVRGPIIDSVQDNQNKILDEIRDLRLEFIEFKCSERPDLCN